MNSNSAAGLLGFWMMMQLFAMIALLLGGIYALYCLGRASAGLDRMASALEEWLARQNSNQSQSAMRADSTSSGVPFSQRINANVPSAPDGSTPVVSASPAPVVTAPGVTAPPVQPQPFVPPSPTTEYPRSDESTA